MPQRSMEDAHMLLFITTSSSSPVPDKNSFIRAMSRSVFFERRACNSSFVFDARSEEREGRGADEFEGSSEKLLDVAR